MIRSLFLLSFMCFNSDFFVVSTYFVFQSKNFYMCFSCLVMDPIDSFFIDSEFIYFGLPFLFLFTSNLWLYLLIYCYLNFWISLTYLRIHVYWMILTLFFFISWTCLNILRYSKWVIILQKVVSFQVLTYRSVDLRRLGNFFLIMVRRFDKVF